CADCKARLPRWASWNLGIFLCVQCASVHRKIGTHVTKVCVPPAAAAAAVRGEDAGADNAAVGRASRWIAGRGSRSTCVPPPSPSP
ncbi:hypothetical protein CALCODRAFT_441337, partial [Calocera cornea HHB12733]